VIRELHRRLPRTPISIDTTKAQVAEEAVRAGARIINDVSGLRFDPAVAAVARRHRTPLILMHLRGRPETMQSGPFAREVWRSVAAGLSRSIRRALESGVRRSQLIIDPGLGFGKTRRQNFEILARLERLRRFRLPVLIGTSHKSFVQAMAAGGALATADAAAVVAAILGGAQIVRVHDVAAVLPAVRLADAILEAGSPSGGRA
jgi:dihydropteroate synthase